MKRPVLGWDVGGANLKAARLGEDERADPVVVERPFPLWRDPGRLPALLTEAARCLGSARSMAVTMTAELADCFATKGEGVAFVLDAFRTAFPDASPWVFGVDGAFRTPDDARRAPLEVAAANWLASATVVARTFPDAIFIDVGSTTTDVIPIVNGRVGAVGRTDLARLCCGELVYTGALRTPVCAIVRSVPVEGRWCRVAAEHFAIAADAYLWLGRIQEREYTCETPDGRGRSRPEAGARLARVVCADAEMLASSDITAIASRVESAQVKQIAAGIRQVVRRVCPGVSTRAVLAGQGVFLARPAARIFGLTTHDLSSDVGHPAARATPAVAVAMLLAETAGR
jgi:probable H4MPT-linked C1 transfer pathway protein